MAPDGSSIISHGPAPRVDMSLAAPRLPYQSQLRRSPRPCLQHAPPLSTWGISGPGRGRGRGLVESGYRPRVCELLAAAVGISRPHVSMLPRCAAGDEDGGGGMGVAVGAVAVSGVTEHVDPAGASALAVFRSVSQVPRTTVKRYGYGV